MNKQKYVVLAAVSVLAGLTGLALPARAQQAPIERVKLSDNEMTCAQMHAEVGAMDKAVAEAKAAESQGNTTVMAGQAGSVAAEVAGRTGFFGSLGSLTGAILGQVGAQTAAGVAQQSGQTTAQQAAERARQAGARKEHVSSLFLNRGCRADDLAYNPPAPAPGSAQAVAQSGGTAPIQLAMAKTGAPATFAPAPVQALPDLDPDKFFTGKTGGTFGKNLVEVLPANKRVAITGFRVAFVTSNTATAQVRGSYLPGRDTSGARSTLVATLSGVDLATMQALTDAAYADFLAQMRLAGREIVPQEELKEFLAGLDISSNPYSKEADSQTAVVFAPTGMPLWFHHADRPWTDRGILDQKNYRRLAEYSQKMNAITVAPLIVVNFARMSSSGNQSGLMASTAETGATMAMGVTLFSTSVMRSEETRGGIVMKGDEGMMALQGGFFNELQFGSWRNATASDNKGTVGIFNALGNAMGMANAGGAVRSRKETVAETTNATYAAAASEALQRATGTFAKLFQKYPAR